MVGVALSGIAVSGKIPYICLVRNQMEETDFRRKVRTVAVRIAAVPDFLSGRVSSSDD